MNLEVMANSKRPILIEGETGVGKTYLAKKIFSASRFNNSKLLHVNIASLNDDLIASELFGHVRGAFTGATENKKGFCEIVGSGMLFLDEIGELSLQKQASLLTLIDEKKFYKVGSTEEIQFRGRLLFATNKNLKLMVEKKEFREDLYFRLRFFNIVLPNLRDKKNLRTIIWEQFQDLKVKYNNYNVILDDQVVEYLEDYSWPGNFRELRNTLEYFLELGKQKISINDVPSWISLCEQNKSERKYSNVYKEALSQFEREYLTNQLESNNGKINLTAFKTGINKVTLISKLKKYDIDRKQYIINEYRQVDGF